MFRFMIPVLALAITVDALNYQFYHPPSSPAASEAQIRFALENKYDDTGPAERTPVYAYNTYKTIEEALIGYLEDPDTKLPEKERERAIKKLIEPSELHQPNLQRFYPKTVEEYTGYTATTESEYTERYTESITSRPQTERHPARHPIIQRIRPTEAPKAIAPVASSGRRPTATVVLTRLPPKKYYPGRLNDYHIASIPEPVRLQRVHQVNQIRGNPLNVAHYSRDRDYVGAQNSHPQYSFSYGVNVPQTGDHKSAQETRNGDTVSGYYSFADADGKQRTVHYTADDQHGFRAEVERKDQRT